METEASKQSFLIFCRVCEKIVKSAFKNKKSLIRQYINVWKLSPLYNDSDASHSFFPALRLFCPSSDRDRPAFGMKEIRIGQEYVKILCISKDSKDANLLTGYRQSNTDFSDVVFSVMQTRSSVTESKVDIETLNEYLDRIAFGFANNERESVTNALRHLITNLTPLENKWLVRILTKNLRLGISESAILNAFHPQAKQHYEVSLDLKQICIDLKDAEVSSPKKHLQLFKAFRPMLAERISIASPVLTSNKQFYIETKFDGERIILHKSANEFQYFTRNGFDYSSSFNDTLTPFIMSSFSKVDECILDGEMLVYSEILQDIVNKNKSTFDVKRMNIENLAEEHPIYVVFDIVMLNKNLLTEKPLSERSSILESRLKEIKNRLQLAERKLASTKEEAIAALNEAIDRHEEGVMIKEMDSTYKPNLRRKSGWWKLKPEYVQGLVDDLDVVIIGGYYGEGRRAGIISQFLLAVAVKNKDEEIPQEFHSFCRVGSGYSDEELRLLLMKLEDFWIKYDPQNTNKSLKLRKAKPDVVIMPQNSVVVQIKGSELTESDEFETGCTLRFPRLMVVRNDKQWIDCLTTEELQHLRTEGRGKLNTKRLDYDSEEESPSKKRKTGIVKSLAPHFKLADVEDIAAKYNVFEGREICVINGSDKISKSNIEQIIKKLNGTLTANPRGDTLLVAHSTEELKVQNLVNSKKHDILKLDWLISCIEQRKFLLPSPLDYWSMKSETKMRLSRFYDKFGDSYIEDIGGEELKKVLENMQTTEIYPETIEEIAEHLFEESNSLLLFRKKKFYIFQETTKFDPCLKLAEASVIFYGGSIVNSYDEATHVIIDKSDLNVLEKFENLLASIFNKFKIVDYYWVRNQICDSETCN
ncbi:DNA ligase 4-like isoform X2 [Dinothrombium tinctorium]|uniref:DNA ligase n=1 Tax=Dinothrombium tinctorium TaxID=1965070 RepID=A0A443RCH4_9ACAR|nr:DNA ligase 4-like isoform X2 [Dinothrombium tinctorium]